MAIPKLHKIVINMGLGEATSNAKLADVGADELGRNHGQKAVVRRATKSIAQFKLRQGMPGRRDGHAARASGCTSSSIA
jgi:large subunit ribosomal protein L5